MHLRDLISEAVSRVPVVAPGRCVHTQAEIASCDRCVAACPLDAWLLDDDALNIDTERCDGCGLCAARCPQGALTQSESALPKSSGGSLLAASCERTGSDPVGLVIPCVNAIGLQQIAVLYAAGIRRFHLSTGDCQQCMRHDGDALRQRVGLLNSVLRQRGLPEIGLSLRSSGDMPLAVDQVTEPVVVPQLSRRGFFRRMMGAVAEPYPSAGDDDAWCPPGSYLPRPGLGDLALFAPRIDVQRCNGCDACVRICPHDALQLQPDSRCYRVSPADCTGCGLCADVCDRTAVVVEQGVVVEQMEVQLNKYACASCGVEFHTPHGENDSRPLCRICVQVNHQRQLFQVL